MGIYVVKIEKQPGSLVCRQVKVRLSGRQRRKALKVQGAAKKASFFPLGMKASVVEWPSLAA